MDLPTFDTSALEPGTVDSIPVPSGEFWVFAYGSLMWNPGFDYTEASPAILYGYHRRLCLWSVRYRGTEQKPGLVLGLDRGGCCHGYAYLICRNLTDSVVEYLCERELVIGTYDPRLCPILLDDQRKVSALTFVSIQSHPHFAPKLALEETVSVVKNARGARGCNQEYVLNTVTKLDQMGIHNTELHKVADKLTSI